MESLDNVQSTGRFRQILQSAELKLYISFFLSCWGDRMWQFALSIALGSIGNQNMQLTAISGLVNSIVVLFFGATVGRWIDRTGRLKAASTSLLINNTSVCLSAALLFSILYKHDVIVPIWNGGLQMLLVSLSIILCAVSVLASMGTKICMSKDWVVVISGCDKEKLATLNAWMLRLNLTSLVLSPLLAGQIMSSFHPSSGCFFLAVWNLVSFGVEYTFLRLVYNACPDLAIKHYHADNLPTSETADQALLNEGKNTKAQPHTTEKTAETQPHTTEAQPLTSEESHETDELIQKISMSSNSKCCSTVKKHIVSAVDGWKLYFHQSVFPASFALALLYLTALGFDGVTVVYIYSQGVQANILALCQGVGALFGITGSFVYPYLRKRIGLERSGLYGLSSQILCNTFALASIWLPGSSFDPSQYFHHSNETYNNATLLNDSSLYLNNSSSANFVDHSKCSISAFLFGIVTARFGLWLADLSISQIMQENIVEHERGVVNGVQDSLNQTLNMVKDVLVICLPEPSTFGILIIVSYCSVSSGLVSYSFYSYKVRGHLLPFHKKLRRGQQERYAGYTTIP